MDEPLGVPGEREPPLYFAGRKDELDALGAKLRRLCGTGDPTGGLQLTVGVPGIGKTQLAAEFAKRVGGARVLGRKVAAVDLSAEELDSPVDMFKTMGNALDERAQSNRVAQHDDRVSGATAGLLGARGALAMDIARHTPELPGLLRESLRAGMWQGKALVVIIDELQRTSGVDRVDPDLQFHRRRHPVAGLIALALGVLAVGVEVDEPRRDDEARRVEHFARLGPAAADGDDDPVAQGHVGHRVEAALGVDDPPPRHEQVHRSDPAAARGEATRRGQRRRPGGPPP